MYLLFKMSSCLPCLPLQASLEISCATYSDILYLNLTKDCQEFVQIMSWRSVNSSVTVSSSRLWATMLTPGCQPHICFNSTQKKNTKFLLANWPPSSNRGKGFLHPNVKTRTFRILELPSFANSIPSNQMASDCYQLGGYSGREVVDFE